MDPCAPERQIEFLTNLQRLLSEGSFVATYKFALLLALADIAVESGDDTDSPLEVSTKKIAEHFVAYYWRQAAPFTRRILRQNAGRQAGVIRLIGEARERFDGSIAAARRDAAIWQGLVSGVDTIIRQMPLWKLQTVGAAGRLEFLYENVGRGTRIVLKPGVAFCLRKHHGLVADLVKGAWARYVRRHNAEELGRTADLHAFLFGCERANLAPVRHILADLQEGACFYCQEPIRGAESGHVDHFVPWSRYPVDLGHNFVLAHGSCNERKADLLAGALHFESWVGRNRLHGRALSERLTAAGVVCDLSTSIRVAEWAYGQTEECRGLTWVCGEVLEPLAPGWRTVLGAEAL